MNSSTMFTTPILFVAFKRPKLTARVFDRIRQIRPSHLYVAIDGPRNETEQRLVFQVIEEINVDWPCTVQWKVNAENQGCRLAVSSAISWFFDNEAEGIILEDDCLPDLSFFHFCQEMLHTYRDDLSVGHVSGSSFIKRKTSDSYFFSKYPHSWGWAGWARVWQKYDPGVADYETLDYNKVSSNLFERIYWYEKFRACASGYNTWDYQLLYLMLKYNLKAITPVNNLISNIGFGADATHWTMKNRWVANFPTTPLHTISHPQDQEIDMERDQLIFRKLFDRTLPSNLLHLFLFLSRSRSAYQSGQMLHDSQVSS